MGVSYAPATGSVLLHRGLTVALGILIVLVGWVTARRLTTGVLPAAVTAMLLVLSPTLITYSRFITPDVPTALFVALAVLASVHLMRSGSWLAYAVSGLAVGLATSTKYTAVLVAVPVVLAALLRSTDRADFRKAAVGLPLAGACSVLAFWRPPLCAARPRRVLRGLQFERRHYATGHAGMDGSAPLLRRPPGDPRGAAGRTRPRRGSGGHGVGPAAVARRRRARQLSRHLCAVVSMQAVRNDRTIMLILPPLAVLAALAIEPVMTWAHHHRTAGLSAAGAAVVVLVVGVVARLPHLGPST